MEALVADLIQYLVSGVALGAIYALVALGFVVIYRASKIFNFGELLTFGVDDGDAVLPPCPLSRWGNWRARDLWLWSVWGWCPR